MTKETKSVEEDIEELVKKNRMYFSQNYCDPDREEGWQSLWRMTENHLRQTLLSYRQQIAEELVEALEGEKKTHEDKEIHTSLCKESPEKANNHFFCSYTEKDRGWNIAITKAQEIIRKALNPSLEE